MAKCNQLTSLPFKGLIVLCVILQVTSRRSRGHEDVEDDSSERILVRNTSVTPPRRQNPSPSPAASSASLQMNHIGPAQLPRRSSSVSTTSVPDMATRRQRRLEAADRHSLQWFVDESGPSNAVWNDEDQESTLADNDDRETTDKPADSREVTDDRPRLEARPSLRLRRNFDCPDLVIINRNPSAQDVATACTSHADAAPPPPSQRRLSPPVSSSSSESTSASRLPRRRLTLPGIIKYDPADPSHRNPGSSRTPLRPQTHDSLSAVAPAVDARSVTPPTVQDSGFGVRGGRPAAEMYLVENCARKRLQEEQLSESDVSGTVEDQHTTGVSSILDTPTLDGLDPPKPLTMRYR